MHIFKELWWWLAIVTTILSTIVTSMYTKTLHTSYWIYYIICIDIYIYISILYIIEHIKIYVLYTLVLTSIHLHHAQYGVQLCPQQADSADCPNCTQSAGERCGYSWWCFVKTIRISKMISWETPWNIWIWFSELQSLCPHVFLVWT